MLWRASRHRSRPFRLLVETEDPSLAIADFVDFSAAGFDVVCCSGPREGDPCPATEGRNCPLVEDSDVVLNQLTDRNTQKAVLDGVSRTAPGVPMVVALPAGVDLDLPDGCVPLPATTSVNGQVQAVRRAATMGGRSAQVGSSDDEQAARVDC